MWPTNQPISAKFNHTCKITKSRRKLEKMTPISAKLLTMYSCGICGPPISVKLKAAGQDIPPPHPRIINGLWRPKSMYLSRMHLTCLPNLRAFFCSLSYRLWRQKNLYLSRMHLICLPWTTCETLFFFPCLLVCDDRRICISLGCTSSACLEQLVEPCFFSPAF